MDQADRDYLDTKFEIQFKEIKDAFTKIGEVNTANQLTEQKVEGHINDPLRHKELKVPCSPLKGHLKDHGEIKKEKSGMKIAVLTILITGSLGGLFAIIIALIGVITK